jgi:YHS domain-containing protein
MSFIVRVLKYMFWLLVVSWSVMLLQRLVGKMATGTQDQDHNRNVDVTSNVVNQKLVRDPVCGMHVAEGLTLPVRQGNEIVHFCSADCRDKYLNGTQKISASA